MALSTMHSGEGKNKTGRTTDAQCKRLDMICLPERHDPVHRESVTMWDDYSTVFEIKQGIPV